MTTDTIKTWSTSLPKLTSLTLNGPFLPRKEGWIAFFEGIGPRLQELRITQSPRIDLEVLEVLVEKCPNLSSLHLTEIGLLDSDCLAPLASLPLQSLTIASPGKHISDEAVAALLPEVGGTLTSLDLSGNPELSDALLDSLPATCPNLTRLALRSVPLSDVAVARYFSKLAAAGRPGFTHLDLEKGHELGSGALTALLEHSGQTLHDLSIMGWRKVDADAVAALAEAHALRRLDLGWCRQVTDWTIKDIVEGCPHMTEIRVFGKSTQTEVWGWDDLLTLQVATNSRTACPAAVV